MFTNFIEFRQMSEAIHWLKSRGREIEQILTIRIYIQRSLCSEDLIDNYNRTCGSRDWERLDETITVSFYPFLEV